MTTKTKTITETLQAALDEPLHPVDEMQLEKYVLDLPFVKEHINDLVTRVTENVEKYKHLERLHSIYDDVFKIQDLIDDITPPWKDDLIGEDPKGEAGSKKCPMHLLPTSASQQQAWVHGLGAKKYGPWNWRESTVEVMTYVGAIQRHLAQFVEGEDVDMESGRSHLAHIMASCAILIDAVEHNPPYDNRPV